MKTVSYFRVLLLTAFWGLLLAVVVVIRALSPAVNLPAMDIPLLLAVSLLVLLTDHYLGRSGPGVPVVTAAPAALAFGLLPLCAGLAVPMTALKLALAGGLTFLAASLLFDSAIHRLSTGPRAKAAPVAAAFALFLAGQCFTNIFF